jgi:hypothetical protein
MFRGIVKVAIVALGMLSAVPLSAQQREARQPRQGREWVRQHPRAARAIARNHRQRQFRRNHPALAARQHQRMAMRRLQFRHAQRFGAERPMMRAPRGR